MATRVSFQVEKRGGSRERLRATKLGRSIFLALGGGDPTAAVPLVHTVLDELRPLCEEHGGVTSARIAMAVEHALRASGRAGAAARYRSTARERARRSSLWSEVLTPCGAGLSESEPPVAPEIAADAPRSARWRWS